jgi:outer membrane protein TolC
MKKLVFILLLLCSAESRAQQYLDSLLSPPDTAFAFSLDHFYFTILENHPVARQINLMSDLAREEVRLARGNFDPKLELEYLTKNFKDTEYYNTLQARVKFPSVLPVDPSIGFDRNTGDYLNPEKYISDDFQYRQLYAGLALPLGRGLFTDERRTALQQAQLFGQQTEAEQIKIANKLLLEAAKDYWQWFYAYYQYRLMERSVVVADEIFKRVRWNAMLGEAATIDTVQAFITRQQRIVERQEAWVAFQNSGVVLSNYMWDSVGNPQQIPANWIPVLPEKSFVMSTASLEALFEQARENHPELRKLRVKLLQLEADRKLATEFLKPRLDLQYYFLNQPLDPAGGVSFTPGNDYKFGVDFSFPIFLRKERAKLNQIKLKINSTQLDRTLSERQILNEIQASFNTLVATQGILEQQNQMVAAYERLLSAELLNLENGESDLFKINIQQEKLIQSQAKWLKLRSEYEKQKALLWWAAGVRNLNAGNL